MSPTYSSDPRSTRDTKRRNDYDEASRVSTKNETSTQERHEHTM